MSITLEQAKKLQPGEILYHMHHKNRQGEPQRWRVNGKVKTWKKSPQKVSVPLKHGLYAFDYLTEDNLHALTLDENEARRNKALAAIFDLAEDFGGLSFPMKVGVFLGIGGALAYGIKKYMDHTESLTKG